ncbi:asparaginase [Microvirga sp. M2]|uniref:asparaginase n=1 Tax=Microvirga sp. M2 TaxID=3073270 RepID=UPI0039C3DF53
MSKPRVAVIGTGGTISTISSQGSLDFVDYMVSGTTLHVDELIRTIPEAAEFAELIPLRFRAVSSTALGFDDWRELALTVDRLALDRPDVAGVVILHGTATMEETAYMLQLTLKTPLPVVFVGSQRPLNALSSDAAGNFVNAVRVACSPQARDMGVLVCLNDEIQAAREVTKFSTSRLHTFRTPDFGILGQVDNDGVNLYRRPLRKGAPDTEFDLRDLTALPRVDIVYSYVGEDGAVVDALVALGAKGIVVAAFPGGRLSPAQLQACTRALDENVAIVLSTRAGSGRAMLDRRLQEMGMISADNLNPQKARILLALALTVSNERSELERIFATY